MFKYVSMLNNKTSLAKNTIFLYLRMFVILFVSLFTTRVILKNLGIEDYGIYNVVGSVVALFSFFQAAISSANYRFFAYSIGERNLLRLHQLFKSALVICFVIVVLTIILGGTFGVYYIFQYLNAPHDRLMASFWTFLLSLVSCCVSTAYMPYYSDVIAHEHMSFFAYLSIIEALLKIFVAYLISMSPIDRLVFYAFLILLCNVIVLVSYILYGRYKFLECRNLRTVRLSKSLLKEMSSFSGWTLFVTIADIFVMQGINMLINSFFTPAVNAARGIAVQIQTAVDQFRGNLQTAFNPQITKQYAAKENEKMYQLMFASGKYAAFVMLLLSIPLMFSIDYVLKLWLVVVPTYTAIFLKLILVSCIIDGISNPFITAIGATGNIGRFQTLMGTVKLLSLPLCWLILKWGGNPVQLFWIYLCVTVFVVILRIYIASKMVNLSLVKVCRHLVFPLAVVAFISYFIDKYLFSFMQDNLLSFFLFCLESTICIMLVIFLVGMERREKQFLLNFISNKLKRHV